MRFLILLLLCSLSLPGLAQEEDDELLRELEDDRKKQTEAAVKINQVRENLSDQVVSIPEQLKKLGYEKIDTAALMNPQVVTLVQTMFKDSPLKSRPPEEVRKQLLENLKDVYLSRFLLNNPRVMDCVVDIVRDDKAMPALIGIFHRKGDFKIYAGIWVCLVVLGWLFKKIVFGKDWSAGKRFLLGFLVNVTVMFLSLGFFYRMFEAELAPAAEIVYAHITKS